MLYFELGGFERRRMFWNLWCERVKFLCPDNSASSRSETSVATSSSGSTLYILNKKVVTTNGVKQLWYRFGSSMLITNGTTIQTNLIQKWPDKYLYLGKNFELDQYQPIIHTPTIETFIKQKKTKKMNLRQAYPSTMEEKDLNIGDTVQVRITLSNYFILRSYFLM